MNVYLYWFDRVLGVFTWLLGVLVPVALLWVLIAPETAQRYVPGVSLVVASLERLQADDATEKRADAQTLDLLSDPKKHLTAWGYEAENASSEDILSSAIRDGRLQVARAAIFTNEPLTDRLLYRVVIPNELKNDLVEHGNWAEEGGLCAHLTPEKALSSALPVKDENIGLLADHCPAEKWKLRREVDAIMKDINRVEMLNQLAEQKLGIARQDCYRFFFSTGFRQQLEQSMVQYSRSEGREVRDIDLYAIRSDLLPFVKTTPTREGALAWLRSEIDFGNITAVDGQLVSGPQLKGSMSPVEERVQQSIDELARDECYALRPIYTPEPELASRARSIRPYLE